MGVRKYPHEEAERGPGKCNGCQKKLTRIVRYGGGHKFSTVECGEAHICITADCTRSVDLSKVPSWRIPTAHA